MTPLQKKRQKIVESHMDTELRKDAAATVPFIVKLLGNPDGTIKGIEVLRDYFAKGLAAYPNLEFTLYYVRRVTAHYVEAPTGKRL